MKYNNFDTAIFCTVNDLIHISNLNELEENFDFLTRYIKINKVYLETFRCSTYIEKEKMEMIKGFFREKGIKISGAITTAVRGATPWEFKSFCYTQKEQREELKRVVAFTAELFDEIILDDFYFTNCKCESCVAAKGERSWSDFRTGLMKEISDEVVMQTAKAINPNVNVIIKFPNWYDHYQSTGYNLKDEPLLFDSVYTGTEIRDSEYTQQNLQRYTSYFLMRYLENVKPGKNLGGWFDSFDCMHRLGAYAEQAYLTLFAKAREITLFSAGILTHYHRIFVPLAGFILDELDKFVAQLGNPIGLSCYKPYHSIGEDYLHGYLGMLGIPLEPLPEYPKNQQTVLLTESAAKDEKIVEKIKSGLLSGKTVIITSGLLKALQHRGIKDIAEITHTDRKASVSQFACEMKECAFKNYYFSSKPILIPQLDFSTNDSWQVVVALGDSKNFPILLESKYGTGKLYVLTIPENSGDLYNYPQEVLNTLRQAFLKEMPVQIEGPANIGLFLYDNHTFIVESFLPYNSDIQIVVSKEGVKLKDLIYGITLEGASSQGKTSFTVNLQPTAYRVFKYEV